MALPTASDNPFPSLLLVETGPASVATPAAGRRRLVVDPADNVLKWKDEAGLVSPISAVNKWDATTAPAVTDDSGDGYAVGSRWIDVTADKEYVCLDASVGAAVWTETTQAGGGGGSDAWTEIKATADQTVTNSSTKVSHAPASGPALTFAAAAGTKYHVEFFLLYSGNQSGGDARIAFAIPSLTKGFRAMGWISHSNGLASAVGHSSDGATTQWPNADIGAHVGTTSGVIYPAQGAFILNNETTGDVVLKFANVTANAGRESTIRAGSTLRYRPL